MFVIDGMIDHGNLARVMFSMKSTFKTGVSSLLIGVMGII